MYGPDMTSSVIASIATSTSASLDMVAHQAHLATRIRFVSIRRPPIIRTIRPEGLDRIYWTWRGLSPGPAMKPTAWPTPWTRNRYRIDGQVRAIVGP